MSFYKAYLDEIESRRSEDLSPKPIDDGKLVEELILLIEDSQSEYRADALNYLIYNTLPGTTSAAAVKARFLENIIKGVIKRQDGRSSSRLSLEILLDLYP